MPVTTAGGVLLKASDGHITRGGEFEKRAAFVPTYDLPEGATVSLFADRTSLYVFGHGSTPYGMPPQVAYQQLAHPDGTTALVKVISADLYAGKIYAVGEFADGSLFHYYDGVRVEDWYDGRASATFRVTGGTATSKLDITVAGIAVCPQVTWATSNDVTASAIATAINTAVTVPNYTAKANGTGVTIVAETAGTAANDRSVAFTLTAGFKVDPEIGLHMAFGSDDVDSYQPGPFVRTIGSKMYAVNGPNVHFSGIKEPTKWTTDTVGAGFIDMSIQTSGSEELTALAVYQELVAVFAERVIQIWFMDPDPALNRKRQVLKNTGTSSPRSVTEFGDADLFYLDESGIRSLRARDSSNAAATADVGVLIDDLVQAHRDHMEVGHREHVYGLIEPRTGNLWMCMCDKIFVFSFFPGAKVSAWTTYDSTYFMLNGAEVTFHIEDVVVFERNVYLRSGDRIFCYGGVGEHLVYDRTSPELWLPYLDGSEPTKLKPWTGVDAAVVGEWSVHAAMDPNNEAAESEIATAKFTTYNDETVGAGIGVSSHISLRFRGRADGYAKLGAAVIHFTGAGNED